MGEQRLVMVVSSPSHPERCVTHQAMPETVSTAAVISSTNGGLDGRFSFL